MITYQQMLELAQRDDIFALAVIAGGEPLSTNDPAQAEAYQAQGVRLHDAGLLEVFKRGLQERNGVNWHIFEGRVKAAALLYVAQLASERLALSRNPLPA